MEKDKWILSLFVIALVVAAFLGWNYYYIRPLLVSKYGIMYEPSIIISYDNQTKYVLLVDLCDLRDLLSKEEMIRVVQNITEAQLEMILGECKNE